MPHHRNRPLALVAGVFLALAGCSPASGPTARDRAEAPSLAPGRQPQLGLMTSLPLYWPEGAGLAELAASDAPLPWQRGVLEDAHELVPLDTLSPVPGLSPDAPETDPLAGIERLAIVQPRGLSPTDNVALDDWVRAGGHLLLVLDPALTGDYHQPLGDPRRPVDTALIPPVVERWGLAVSFDDTQAARVTSAPFAGAALPLALPGRIAITDPGAADCALAAGDALATCAVGEGRVTLLADAALFEHRELAGEEGQILAALLAEAFGQQG